jgi:hypothetical protein
MSPSEYLVRVKNCRCVICWYKLGAKVSPCDAHHPGTGDERDDFATVALCKEHHQGATGVHGLHRKAFHSLWKTSDLMLLAWTNREIHR